MKYFSFTREQAVRANTLSSYVYPDTSVACDLQCARHPERSIDVLTNPIIIVEATSHVSKIRDHNNKLEAYRINDSLRDYIVIECYSVCATHYQRIGGEWRKTVYTKMSDIINTSLEHWPSQSCTWAWISRRQTTWKSDATHAHFNVAVETTTRTIC